MKKCYNLRETIHELVNQILIIHTFNKSQEHLNFKLFIIYFFFEIKLASWQACKQLFRFRCLESAFSFGILKKNKLI